VKARRKRILWAAVIGGFLIFMGTPLVLIGQQFRQEALDQALIEAVKRLNAPAVNRLLSEGASANARDTGDPPLTVSSLLARLVARFQHTPDGVAANYGDQALLLLITCARRSHSQKNQAVADTIAAALVLHGADMRVRGERQETPLADVADYDPHRTLRLMLSRGVDVNTHDDTGVTPLMGADAYSTNLLIQYGANVKARDAFGRGTLFWAEIEAWRPDKHAIISVLRQHGARLNRGERDYLEAMRAGRLWIGSYSEVPVFK
jgi:ankyrin repeat protein